MSARATLTCIIASPDKTAAYDELQSVGLPASSGFMQILPGHAEAFVTLNAGDIILTGADGAAKRVHVEASECHVIDDRMAIIA